MNRKQDKGGGGRETEKRTGPRTGPRTRKADGREGSASVGGEANVHRKAWMHVGSAGAGYMSLFLAPPKHTRTRERSLVWSGGWCVLLCTYIPMPRNSLFDDGGPVSEAELSQQMYSTVNLDSLRTLSEEPGVPYAQTYPTRTTLVLCPQIIHVTPKDPTEQNRHAIYHRSPRA